MNKMGSPWPWTQEPVKPNPASGPTIGSIIHHNNNHHHHHNNNNNNNKRGSFGYNGSYMNPASFYNNHLNQSLHNQQHFSTHPQQQQQNPHHQQQQQHSNHSPHPSPHHNLYNRFIPTSPPSSAPVPMDTSGSGDLIQRKRPLSQQQQPTYFTFDGIQPPHQNNQQQHYLQNHHHQQQQHPPNHHHHHSSNHPSVNNGNYGGGGGGNVSNLARKFSNSSTTSSLSSPSIIAASSPTTISSSSHSPLTPFSSSSVNTANNNNNHNNNSNGTSHYNQQNKHQSQFVTVVKEIPTWNRYYSDQKHRIIDFTDKNNSIRPDSFINQLVSLCFVDTCITNLAVDAIVNSTTEEYSGSFGVDKLIHHQAGRSLREACKSLPRLGPGQAEMTVGFALPAKYVIHTNGPLTEDDGAKPMTDDADAAKHLTGCYVNSFNLLLRNKLRTIAFPCISTGKKRLSKKFAAEIALRTVRRFLEEHKHSVDRVIFCLHHQMDIEIYLRYMQIYFPVVEPPFTITIT